MTHFYQRKPFVCSITCKNTINRLQHCCFICMEYIALGESLVANIALGYTSWYIYHSTLIWCCIFHTNWWYALNNTTRRTVMCHWSSGVWDTVCHLPELTFSCFQPFIAHKLLDRFSVLDATVSLLYVSNLKGINPAVPKICGSKSHSNFFIFFFFAALINPFKNNLPLLQILSNLHHQLCYIMP